MSNEYLSKPDAGLAQAEKLIARVLDFVTLDEGRLTHFLLVTGLRPERMQEPALRSFVLDVIDMISADHQLLEALLNLEQIRAEDIDLARARLMFEAAAAHGDPMLDGPTDRAIRARVKQLLRALALLTQIRKGADRRSA